MKSMTQGLADREAAPDPIAAAMLAALVGRSGRRVISLDDPEADSRLFRGKDRVEGPAIAAADRAKSRRTPASRPAAKPVQQPRARNGYASGPRAEIIAARRDQGHLQLLAKDPNGRKYGVSRDPERVWHCQCTPEVDNPGCQHQQAALTAIKGAW